MAPSRAGVEGTAFWLAGAVRVLQKEVRELRGLQVDRQSYLGRNQDELAEITEKQLKNAHSMKYRATTESVDVGEARPPGATTESELAEYARQFSVDVGKMLGMLGLRQNPNELVKFGLQRKQSTPWNRLWFHSFTRTSMRLSGPFTAWTCPVHSFSRTLLSCNVTSSAGPSKKSARLSPNGPEVFEFDAVRGSALQPLLQVKGDVSLLRKSARRFLEVFEISSGSGSPPEALPCLGGLLAENDMQTLEIHETIWSETFEDETLHEIAVDERSPEIHEIAGSGLERSANLLLRMRWRSTGKSREIQRQTETGTRRAIWDIVEENLQRLESLANTGNGEYQCERNSGRKL